MLSKISADLTHDRFLQLNPTYQEIQDILPQELKIEHAHLGDQMEMMPSRYGGEGDHGIDGPLNNSDQKIWDRYSELNKIGKGLLKAQGWMPTDPASQTLSGRLQLRVLKLVGKPPRNFGVYN